MILPIPKYPGYFASKDGCIFSMKKSGKLKPIKGSKTVYGYLRACLKTGKVRRFRPFHQLILETFVGEMPNGMEGCHNNGDKLDNRLSNLRWATRSQNHLDKWKYGDGQAGHLHPCHKLTSDQAKEIILTKMTSKKRFWGADKLAKKFGVHRTTIERISRNVSWKTDHAFQDAIRKLKQGGDE